MAAVIDNLDRQFFHDNGFVLLKDKVPRDVRERALGLVNETLEGVGGPPLSAEEAKPWVAAKSALQRDARILELAMHVHDVLLAMLEDPALPCMSCQIASRFPGERSHETTMGAWHIDNFTPKDLQHRRKRPAEFDILVGIVLGEHISTRDRGPLGVWPGGHLTMAEYVTRVGGEDALAEEGLQAAIAALGPPNNDIITRDNVWPVLAQPGDVILAHRMLPHTVLPNESAVTRHIVYFRIASLAAPNKPLGDLWGGWRMRPETVDQQPVPRFEWVHHLHWFRRGRMITASPSFAKFRCKTALTEPNRFASAVTVEIRRLGKTRGLWHHGINVHTNGALSPLMHDRLSKQLTEQCRDSANTTIDAAAMWTIDAIWRWDYNQLIEAAVPAQPLRIDHVEFVFQKFDHESSKGRMIEGWVRQLGCNFVLRSPDGFSVSGRHADVQCLKARILMLNWKGVTVNILHDGTRVTEVKFGRDTRGL